VLESEGHLLACGVFSRDEIAALRSEIDAVYDSVPPDCRPGSPTLEHAQMFRYEMFNRSPLCQEAISRPAILHVLEPLLGDDCHAISCTAWRNPPGRASAPEGQQWHVDGGPYIARTEEQRWPEHIPYPIFVVTTHIYLQDVSPDDGPTSILPGSHRSGRLPPHERMWDVELEYEGRRGVPHLARAGDVTFFVSETWHRRMPTTAACKGRFFLQTAFGRREIAQRVRLSEEFNATTAASRARAKSDRQRQVIGLHGAGFYDG
jgi:ectoine hydroxylase-related dioxygenase (phytanoyl-CoA dioxygenase family)